MYNKVKGTFKGVQMKEWSRHTMFDITVEKERAINKEQVKHDIYRENKRKNKNKQRNDREDRWN